MILVREVFQLKFGKAKEAKALMKEFNGLFKKYNYPTSRLLTDLTGQYYQLIMEIVYDNLAAFEASMANNAGAEEFGKIYGQFMPLVESGRREIFTIVE